MFVASFKLKSAVQRLLCEVREILDFAEHHPTREMQKLAVRETVEYIQSSMQGVIGTYTTRQIFDIALNHTDVSGHFLEFGVFQGGTIRYIAMRRPKVDVHGFDSFEGLPEAWSGFSMDKGAFARSGKLPRVPKNVTLHKGWFDATLPGWLKANSGQVAFLHVDCDLYSSTKTIFEGLSSRIIVGTVIVFDEYFGYPNWKNHEYKAFQEFVAEHQVTYEYLVYARTQVAVKIRKIGRS
jgi:hypothetical protein